MLKFSKEKLKDIMVAKKFDVKNLAEKSGVGVTTIYEILNGKKKNPKSETLSKLAYAMEIYVDDFFYDDSLPIDNNLDKNIYDNKLEKHKKMFKKEKIEEYMKAKDWTAYKLAKEAKIGVSTLYEILNGKKKNPSADTLSKIAIALNVSVDDFFNENKVEAEYKELLSKISKLDDSKKQLIKNLISEFEKSN